VWGEPTGRRDQYLKAIWKDRDNRTPSWSQSFSQTRNDTETLCPDVPVFLVRNLSNLRKRKRKRRSMWEIELNGMVVRKQVGDTVDPTVFLKER
jgi:hypothetical protein